MQEVSFAARFEMVYLYSSVHLSLYRVIELQYWRGVFRLVSARTERHGTLPRPFFQLILLWTAPAMAATEARHAPAPHVI